MLVTDWLKEDFLRLVLGLLILGAGLVVDHYAKPLPEVENTFKALEWAEANNITCACDAFTCEIAVQEYMKAHNLAPEEFPYYCWSDTAPMSPSEKLAVLLMSIGSPWVVVALSWLLFDAAKVLLRR